VVRKETEMTQVSQWLGRAHRRDGNRGEIRVWTA
jgi:hypothetical protein